MRRLYLLFAVLVLAQAAFARLDPARLLERARSDANTYKATGTTTFMRRGRQVSVDFVLYHKKGKCRIEYTSGPLAGAVTGTCEMGLWRFDPKLNKLTAMDACSSRRFDARAELAGAAKVVGRPVYILAVKRQRLWVDKETCTILRRENYGPRGRLSSVTEFSSIRYGELPDSIFKQPDCHSADRHARKMSLAALQKALGFPVSVPRYVPKGYKLEGYRLYSTPCGCRAAYTRYDGPASISIFEMLSARKMPCAASGACGQAVELSARGRTFTVIGDLSRAELQKIAESLR
ncbi:MAG: LolA family protein [Armatimonadota bacterium]